MLFRPIRTLILLAVAFGVYARALQQLVSSGEPTPFDPRLFGELESQRNGRTVNDDQLSLAIGKRGQSVRLAARLTNWDVDILTPPEFTKSLDVMEETLAQFRWRVF